MKAIAAQGARYAVGLVLGTVTAVAGLLFTLLGGLALLPVLAWPRGRRAVRGRLGAVAARLAELERRRLGRFLGTRVSAAYAPYSSYASPSSYASYASYASHSSHFSHSSYGNERAARYVVARWPLGLLGGLVIFCVLVGLLYVGYAALGWTVHEIEYPWAVAGTGLLGLFLVFLAGQSVFGIALLEGHVARRLLGPSHHDELERRIAQLATTRAGMMDAVDGERRRIERDLHDGVQQRLVALGMLLGRARRSRDADRANQLLLQAHEESRRALAELREVAWRIYPTVLDEAGLRAALETVAERTPLPVHLAFAMDEPPPSRRVGTVAYFVVSEAVTNVVKHSGATRITVAVRRDGPTLVVRVEDDGAGGADPAGGGLTGLASRVAALDGRFRVDSPAGGPTVVTAELPCV